MRSALTIITLLTLLACTPKPSSDIVETVITHVNIISMTGQDRVSSDQSVVIRDGKIYKTGTHTPSTKATIVDGTGLYLMPGLTEMHAHIPVAEAGNDTLVKETLYLYLSQGVTNIRGMLGNPYHLGLREEVADGNVLGPRIYTSSPSMNGNSVKTPEEAKEKVTQYKEEGYDFLKIHPGIQIEVWDVLERTAQEVGIPYAGHVPVDVGIRRALNAGYGTVDHLDGYLEGLVPASAGVAPDANGFFGYNFTDIADESIIPELVKMTIDNDVAVVSTQTLFTRWFSPKDPAVMMEEPEMKYMPAQTRFTWRQNKSRLINDESYNAEQWERFITIRKKLLSEMDRQGVTFLLGSDAPQVMNVPGFSLHHEMRDMSDAGIPPYKILESGTIGPAKYFGAEGQYGTIQTGSVADLILLGANPLDDIANTSRIEGVFVRGQYLSKEEIAMRLEEIARRHE